MLPDIDGYRICERMRSDSRTRDIPVIFITAMGRDEIRAAGAGNRGRGFHRQALQPRGGPRARVRTHMELKNHRDALQQLVGERTAKLAEINARLEREVEDRRQAQEDLQAAHDMLEARVRERTFELERANLELVRQVAERRKNRGRTQAGRSGSSGPSLGELL